MDKGAWSFLTQVLLITCPFSGHLAALPVSTVWPTGPRIPLPSSCPYANSSCGEDTAAG